ncbi:MAG: hypothetical protein O3B90_08215 [Actinomycetota bacterium]|nr:hypothetical protein [Actinomycetota bacterium]
MSRQHKFMAALAVVPLLFAACGGSSSDGSTADAWCDFADEADVVDEILSSLGADSSDLEAGITQMELFVQRLPDEAPDEIKEPAKKRAEGTQMLVDAIKAADYNVFDADLGFMQDVTLEADLDAASEKLDVYTETNCGRSFSSGDDTDTGDGAVDTSGDAVDDSGDFNPGDGTIREQLVAQFVSIGLANEEAECIADKLDFNDPAVQSGDIAAMLGVFEECGIGLDRLAELGGG